MLLHVTPLYLTNVLGSRAATIGLIEGIAESTGSLIKIGVGGWSDRVGRRKPFAVAGYALSALAVPVLGLAGSWHAVGVARFLDRAGKGLRTAPRDALIADSVAPERRGAGFGVHRAADSAGAFTGLVVALWLVWRSQRGDAALDAATFRTIVGWAVLPAALATLVLALGVRDVVHPAGRATRFGSLAGFDPRFRRFLAVVVLFALGNSSDAFLVLRAQSVGMSVLGILAMIAAYNLVYAVVAGPLGVFSDRVDRRRLVLAGWGLYGAVYLGFAGATSPWHLWVLYAGYGLYYAATEGVAKALVADLVPVERRGTAYGWFNAAIGLAALPASVVAGVLWQGIGSWDGLGPAAPFVFGGTMALLAGSLLWGWVGSTGAAMEP